MLGWFKKKKKPKSARKRQGFCIASQIKEVQGGRHRRQSKPVAAYTRQQSTQHHTNMRLPGAGKVAGQIQRDKARWAKVNERALKGDTLDWASFSPVPPNPKNLAAARPKKEEGKRR